MDSLPRPLPLAELHVRAAFYRAVIAVYRPWITSPVVGGRERELAMRRVAAAHLRIEELRPPRWPEGAWKPHRQRGRGSGEAR